MLRLLVPVALVTAFLTAGQAPPFQQQRDTLARVQPGFDFLAKRMDHFQDAFVLYDDMDSGGIQFFPSGWMGDLVGVPQRQAATIIDDECAVRPHKGSSCIQLTYPANLAKTYAGIYWLYPDLNFGKQPGYDLSRYADGATLVFACRGELSGEVAEFKIGGVNRPARPDEGLPHPDSFGPISTGKLTLTKEWREVRLPLRGDMSNLSGGFCWVSEARDNPRGCRIYLDSLRIELGQKGRDLRLNEPHFIPSYLCYNVGKPERYFRNVCFCYDQALALMAFLARGQPDDLRREIGRAHV